MKVNIQKNHNFFVKTYEIRTSLTKRLVNKANKSRIFNNGNYQYSTSSLQSKIKIGRKQPQTNIMIIGQTTHLNTDIRKSPLMNRSSLLLNQMLNNIGVNEYEDIVNGSITNNQFPKNWQFDNEKIISSQHLLSQEILRLQPAIIILAGSLAVQRILHFQGNISKIRGYWYRWGHYWLMPIFHPSYLLRHPSTKRNSPKWLTLHDFKNVQSRLNILMTNK